MLNAGASLISSVFGLKERPRIAIVLPLISGMALLILALISSICRSLASMAALTMLSSTPRSDAIWRRAFVSLGKQDPPKPAPAWRNFGPILPSSPMPLATIFTLAPTFSHRFAISFIKDILTARKEFEAYFISSAVSMLAITKGVSMR